MTAEMVPEQAKMEAFVGKAIGNASGALVTLMASIGDRLGLFKALAANGPATSDDLALRTGTDERYVREWLAGMTAAGYIEYDPITRRFTLPPEHVPVLAQEGGPASLGGAHQALLGFLPIVPQVIEAFRHGGGVPQAAYDSNYWEGIERFSAPWYENLLVPVWIPAVSGIQAKLERGVRVADIGCGAGRALIKLAQTFPNSRYVGYDVFPAQVARARANAEAAGVADRVTFTHDDVSRGLPEQYDFITTFDVIHDAVDPPALLRAIRRGLKPDGVYLCVDMNCSDKLEENAGPLGAMLYGISILYCMTTSLAAGGAGLGTAGLPELRLRELCLEAGFGSVRRLPLEDPFSSLYEVRP